MSPRQLLHLRLQTHNRHVLGYTCLTATGAICLWVAAYGAAWWLTLFVLSSAVGGEARPPAHFTRIFFEVAITSVLLAYVHRLTVSDARARDFKSGGEVVIDLLLAIPRVTLAIWGNFSAWQKLTPAETEQALLLLERLQAGRLRLLSVPQEIPDETLRDRLLYSLQLIGLIEIRKEDDEHWLKVVTPAEDLPPQLEPEA